MGQVKWLVVASIAYVLVSLGVVLVLRLVKSPAWKSSLLTFYFTLTLCAGASYFGMWFCYWSGVNGEYLRRASIGAPRDVAALNLIRKSNAKQIAPNQCDWVVKSLETEIDWLLPIANDYVCNRDSWKWRLQDFWYLGDMEPSFQKELPAVVEYRKTHPKALENASYEEIMRRYDRAKQP
jgi:hypothetical protein